MNDTEAKNIDISVVIPAFNEEEIIPLTLESIKNQNFKGNFEIIVVDNNSTDKTGEIAKKYGATVYKESNPGVSFARQKGFCNARGKIIVSTDADTIVPADWLSKIKNIFDNDPLVIGINGGINFFGAKSIKTAFINLFNPLVKMLSWIMSKKGCFWGANFAIKKDAFISIGGFNTKLYCGEDLELGIRAGKFGKIVYKTDLVVETSARRYEASKPRDLMKYYFLNFLYLTFLGKPYTLTFENIRTAHDSNISSGKLWQVSFFVMLALLVATMLTITVYSAFNPRSQLLGKIYWHKKTKEKIIALTFDDGPNEPYTSQILEILNAFNIKATFFELGKNVEYYPETTRKLFANGEIIANHSYSHEMDLALENKSNISFEITSTEDIIYKTTGKYPHLFRPPHGFKSPYLLEDIKNHNLATIEWSDMTNDYSSPGVDKIVKNIVAKARPGGIIVLHDGDKTNHGSDRSETVKALPLIINELQKKGYKFVTIPGMLNISAYNN